MKTTTVKVRPLLWGGFWKPVRALVGLFRLMGKGLGLLGEALLNALEVLGTALELLEKRFTLNLFTIQGVPVRLHWTFPILASVLVGVGLYSAGLKGAGLVLMTLFIAFGIVLLHELGHVMAARFYGVRTQSILLHMLGGTAFIKDPILKPYQEFVITIAGLLVNVILGGAAYGIFHAVAGPNPKNALELHPWLLPVVLVIIFSATMFVFNLLPAYPMDGGRILHSLLGMVGVPSAYATYVAGGVSVVLSLFIVLLGFTLNPLLIFTGFLVGLSAVVDVITAKDRAKAQSTEVTNYTLSLEESIDYLKGELICLELKAAENANSGEEVALDSCWNEWDPMSSLGEVYYPYSALLGESAEDLKARIIRYHKEVAQAASAEDAIGLRAIRVAERIMAENISRLLYGDAAVADASILEEPLRDVKVLQEKCVKKTDTLRTAYLKMQRRDLDYLVVLDEENRIVGVIVRRELAEALSAA